jgi:hypothetical protein
MNTITGFCACLQAPARRSRTIRAELNLQLQVISSGYMKLAILHIANYRTRKRRFFYCSVGQGCCRKYNP